MIWVSQTARMIYATPSSVRRFFARESWRIWLPAVLRHLHRSMACMSLRDRFERSSSPVVAALKRDKRSLFFLVGIPDCY